MSLIRELLALRESDDPDERESFAPKVEKDHIVICADDQSDLRRRVKAIETVKLRDSDIGKVVYTLADLHNDTYALVKAKITKVNFRKGNPNDSMWEYRSDRVSGNFKANKVFNSHEKGERYFDSSSYGNSGLYEIKDIESFLEKMAKKHKDDFDFKNIDPKISKSVVAELGLEKLKRKFELNGKEWEVQASVSASDKMVHLAVLHTPVGGGNIKNGNRMEIFYIPMSDDKFKRHFGSFDVPRSAQEWMNLKDEVSRKEMKDEIQKAFKLAKTKDADAYHKEFVKK